MSLKNWHREGKIGIELRKWDNRQTENSFPAIFVKCVRDIFEYYQIPESIISTKSLPYLTSLFKKRELQEYRSKQMPLIDS